MVLIREPEVTFALRYSIHQRAGHQSHHGNLRILSANRKVTMSLGIRWYWISLLGSSQIRVWHAVNQTHRFHPPHQYDLNYPKYMG